MNLWEKGLAFALVALGWAAITPAFAQNPKDLADIDAAMAKAQEAMSKIDLSGIDHEMARAQAELMKRDVRIPFVDVAGMSADFARMKSDMLFQQIRGGKQLTLDSGQYDSGTRLLDEHKYDEAIQRFDRVIAAKSDRADGALYWKAYALNRSGRRDEAVAAITVLRRDYPNSHWLNDAQALEAEVKQNAGQPAKPGDDSNEDIKLMAINSLMNADAERAIPLVEGILKGSGTPAVKDRALFVLAQNKSPRAQQAIFDYAKGGGNPDLQLRAIQYLGMSGSKEAQQQLVAVYGSTSDAHVKSAIIQALMLARASDALMNLAKSEKDASLRNAAIRNLIVNKGVAAEGFAEMYNGADASTKREIVNGLVARGDAKDLVNLARRESDSAMKKTIVERLSAMRDNKDALDYMMELLK